MARIYSTGFLFLLILFSIQNSFGQSRNFAGNQNSNSLIIQGQHSGPALKAPSAPTQRNCGTMEVDAAMRATNPGVGTLEDFENWLQQRITEQASHKQLPPVYTIPVVVHVIHNSNEAVGTGRNISQAQVLSQIVALNEDFRRLNADTTMTPSVFHSVAADSEIEFCLAQVDPNGNVMAEPGINRVSATSIGLTNTSNGFSTSVVDGTIKPATSWNPNNYFNIWVCQLQGSLLGYAQFPSSSGLLGMPTNGGAANTDGVVIGYNFFGTTGTVTYPFNKGRTTTHEVGHWLGLRHIWGDTYCGTDYCSDTPQHNDENYGCPNQPHLSTCSGSPREMTQNYMDYSDDVCMNIFTSGQKTRMRTVMQNSPRRLSLLSSTVCTPPNSPPVADFTANFTTVTQGGNVSFTDLTAGSPTSWSWTFGGGGTPNTSTTQNPVIQFNTLGTYTVSLTATNAFGTDTETKTAYINVVAATGNCDTITNLTSSNITSYVFDYVQPMDSGYLSGTNYFGDLAKAESYTLNSPNTHLTGGIFYFSKVKDAGMPGTATIAVWDNTGTAGSPGSVIGSKVVPLSSLTSTAPNTIYFDNPVPVTSVYYLGVILPTGTGDSLALYTSQHSATATNTCWEQFSNGAWGDYTSSYTSNPKLHHAIFAMLTDAPPTAAFSASDSTICENASVTFSSALSLNASAYSWSFPGGSPSSSTQANPVIMYNSSGSYPVTLRVFGACGSKDTLIQTSFITVTPSPSISNSVNNVSCNGVSDGSITATVSGGTSPYTYSWNTGATTSGINGLSQGTYTLTVTDNNSCSSVSVININQPAILSSSLSISDESCGNANGTATANPAGGTAPYTYSWNNGGNTATINNLSAGSYIVTITDANNCSVADTATVANQGSLAATTNSVNPSCGQNNGSATVVPGGTAPYTYSWNTGASTASITGLGAGTYTVTVTDANSCSTSASVTLTSSNAPVALISANSPTCAGNCNGLASVNVSGGTAPYSYSWNTTPSQSGSTATGLCAGNYSVTVTDNNGCITVSNVTVTQPTAITLGTNVNNENCNGANGSATVTASGGTGTLTYNWNTSPAQTGSTASNLSAGNYQVTVTDGNGCQQTASVTVVNIGNTTANAGADQNICTGNNATLTAGSTGGSSPYTYLWSSGQTTQSIQVSPTTTTSYTVTSTDANGCADTDTVMVNVTQTPVVTASNDTTICANMPVILTANGASSYTWFPGGQTTGTITVNPSSTTTYSVVGQNGTCQGTPQSVTVTTTPNALALASANPTTTYLSQGGNVQFTSNSVNATSLLWDFGDGSTSTQANPSHSYLITGTYTVILTAFRANCEHFDTLQINVLEQVGISQHSEGSLISVFPNPASERINIRFSGTESLPANLRMFNQLGQVVIDLRDDSGNEIIELKTEQLASGVYYINVQRGDLNETMKIIINR